MNSLYAYLLSLSFMTLVIVYLFNVPGKLTSAHQLVSEYYYEHALVSFILDFFLVGAYLMIASTLIFHLGVNSFLIKCLIVVTVTFVLSYIFFYLFTQWGLGKGTFFSRWFHKVKIYGVIYDCILVTSVYLIWHTL